MWLVCNVGSRIPNHLLHVVGVQCGFESLTVYHGLKVDSDADWRAGVNGLLRVEIIL
jgi:hypothetical protein